MPQPLRPTRPGRQLGIHEKAQPGKYGREGARIGIGKILEMYDGHQSSSFHAPRAGPSALGVEFLRARQGQKNRLRIIPQPV